ncbi:transposable element Tcb1 transposase [Trichonephila clavipes]|nr:transposable element Tcb1 transposase [Trichonephila clavipes]
MNQASSNSNMPRSTVETLKQIQAKQGLSISIVGQDNSRSSFPLDSSVINLNLHVEVSLGVAEIIAKEGRPFTDGDFVKKCCLIASEKLCPEAKRKFENTSLNRRTIQRRIQQLHEDIENQVKSAASNFEYFSLAVDESTDRTSVSQLCACVCSWN